MDTPPQPQPESQQREEAKKSALNANRYRKQSLQQQFRGDLLQQDRQAKYSADTTGQSSHRNRLAIMKANAVKQANAQAGGAVGASVGGAVGSIIPVVGTGAGIFLGRFIGKKAGITGIILFIALLFFLFVVIFIVTLKGYCDNMNILGKTVEYYTIGVCQNFK